jgi:hypothetical protein
MKKVKFEIDEEFVPEVRQILETKRDELISRTESIQNALNSFGINGTVKTKPTSGVKPTKSKKKKKGGGVGWKDAVLPILKGGKAMTAGEIAQVLKKDPSFRGKPESVYSVLPGMPGVKRKNTDKGFVYSLK